MTHEELRRVANAVMQHAREIALGDAHSGRMEESPASRHVREAEFFLHGLNGTLPPAWNSLRHQMADQEQQERRELARLQRKYGA